MSDIGSLQVWRQSTGETMPTGKSKAGQFTPEEWETMRAYIEDIHSITGMTQRMMIDSIESKLGFVIR